ncbi:MAG TPA: hypothetical protein VNZ43_14695 [Sphingomonadaceae bacterium]|jgi:hypothetical protein|nr:hypothetical protein [Sphingomonadaceae bacterium]
MVSLPRPLLFLLAAPLAISAAHAQDAAGQAVANAREQTETQSLNNNIQGNIEATKVVNATNQGQYEADMAQYRASVEQHNQVVARDARRYARQQRAYADAMAVWRRQVASCKKGHTKACNMPTPDPADYY